MIDKQLVAKFKQFQKKTEKYEDFKFEKVEFETVSFSDSGVFTFVKGLNKYVRTYIDNNAGDIAVMGSSLDNKCITSYIVPIAETDIIRVECVSFNKDNAKGSRAFFRNFPFVMDRHHLALIPNAEKVSAKYLYQFLDYFLQTKSYGWGTNVASVDEIKNYDLTVPKSQNNFYTSLKIQEILVEFIEYYQKHTKNSAGILKKVARKITNSESAILPLFFKRDKSVETRFDAFCVENNVNLELADLTFLRKKIISNDKDELVCKKRMGFTPTTSEDGDINWFTVSDLTKNKGFYINKPKTKEKTTLELLKQKVKNSDKAAPIKKGDVLVSFKLTVGLVKIYNSDLPAYCNEAIDILTPFKDVDSRYLAYNCVVEYPKNGEKTNNGVTLNDEHKKLIDILIPEPVNNYTSLELQKIIVEFIEMYLAKMTKKRQTANDLQNLYTKYTQVIIQKTFKNDN